MDLSELVSLVWQYKLRLILIPLLIGLAALAIMQQKTPLYEASGTVVITDKSLAPWLDAADRLSAESEFARTYSYLLELRPFLNEVSKELPFNTEPSDIAQATIVDYIPNSNKLKITARLAEPEKAALLVNKIIDSFPAYLNQLQIAQPVSFQVVKKAETPLYPRVTDRLVIFFIAFSISFLWVINIILFNYCINRELSDE